MQSVERAEFKDTLGIYELIKKYPVEVLPRSLSDIATNIDRFFVYHGRKAIAGAVSWRILPEIGNESEHIVEIVSLCVSKRYQGKGVGRLLTLAIIDHVKKLNPTRIVLLTFSPRFFGKFGFRRISKRRLYNKIYLGCINCTKYTNPLTCPEVAMELKL
jgi:N-acetylglutamate synthase-like GNAT family acetyltransferase